MERNRFSQWMRQNVLGLVAIFIALGGTAHAINTVGSQDIIDGSVASIDLKNNDVRSADIRNETLTNADVLDGTILGGDISNGTLGTNDYGDRSIVGLDIAGNTIEGGNIGSGEVDTTDIADSTIVGLDIAGNTVGGGKITDGTITSTDIDEAQVSGLDRCQPGVTNRYGPICTGSDGNARTWQAAINYCATFGLRMPSVGEAMALGINHDVQGVGADERFWTDGYFYDREDNPIDRVVIVNEGGGVFSAGSITDQAETVCVTTPTN